MTVAKLLDRLEGVRKTGPDSWLARCPSHADKSPSLSVRETSDGKVLLHCFAGCEVHEVLSAVGLELSDLFPETTTHHGKPERRPFPAADVLRAVGHEMLVVAAVARSMAAGILTKSDHERLMLAIERIQAAASAAFPQLRGQK